MDRNVGSRHRIVDIIKSLSARRAWIEIFYYCDHDTDWIVALRKESVDRNNNTWWVKIHTSVALRKESVDRNFCALRCDSSGY